MSDPDLPDELEFVDGCELDFAEDPAPDDEIELLPLFPQGQDGGGLEAAWRELFE